MAFAGIAKWQRGADFMQVARQIARLALYPALTVALFMGMSFASTGAWFVTGGFYVPDPKLQGQLPAVWQAIRDGVVGLAGPTFVGSSEIAAAFLLLLAVTRRKWAVM